jgi:LDH2 family malate/lactate/ureidoglycolate dehydrogenase
MIVPPLMTQSGFTPKKAGDHSTRSASLPFSTEPICFEFVAFRPDLLGPADTFERQVTQLIERVKVTPRQPGVDDIRIPSERAFRSRERALREGLEIDRVVFDALVALRAR